MLRFRSPQLGLARLAVIATTIIAFLLFPVLMTNASAHQHHHGANGPVVHDAVAGEAGRHIADHSAKVLHADEILPVADVDGPSDDDYEHVSEKCCSSFCSSFVIADVFDGVSKIYGGDYAARPAKALVPGEWVVPHRPPNS